MQTLNGKKASRARDRIRENRTYFILNMLYSSVVWRYSLSVRVYNALYATIRLETRWEASSIPNVIYFVCWIIFYSLSVCLSRPLFPFPLHFIQHFTWIALLFFTMIFRIIFISLQNRRKHNRLQLGHTLLLCESMKCINVCSIRLFVTKSVSVCEQEKQWKSRKWALHRTTSM